MISMTQPGNPPTAAPGITEMAHDLGDGRVLVRVYEVLLTARKSAFQSAEEWTVTLEENDAETVRQNAEDCETLLGSPGSAAGRRKDLRLVGVALRYPTGSSQSHNIQLKHASSSCSFVLSAAVWQQ